MRATESILLAPVALLLILFTACASSHPPLGAWQQEFDSLDQIITSIPTSSPSAEILQGGREKRRQGMELAREGKEKQASRKLQLALADARTAYEAARSAEAAEEAVHCRQAAEKARVKWEQALRQLVETEQVARRTVEGVPHEVALPDLSPASLPPSVLLGSAPPPPQLDLAGAAAIWAQAAAEQRVPVSDLYGRLNISLEAMRGSKGEEAEFWRYVAGRTLQEMEARVRTETSTRVCVGAAGAAADLADAADRARAGTLQLERSLRDDLRAELEKSRAEAEDRQSKLFDALQQIQGKYARISRDARGTIVSLADILFDFDKATLKRNVEFSLVRVATILNQFPEMRISVEGHTDNVGTAEYNLDLSERRARAVYEFLVSQGVSEDRMTVAGYGMTRPVADNATEEGRQRNRRVDLVIQDESAGSPDRP